MTEWNRDYIKAQHRQLMSALPQVSNEERLATGILIVADILRDIEDRLESIEDAIQCSDITLEEIRDNIKENK